MTMSMVSIDRETQWIPFEPNNAETWLDTERTVSAFMLRLWRRGMLDGVTPNDAFFVRCDQTTMSQDDRDNGRLICEIGLRPPWPAEFVIVRIGKTESGMEML